MRRGKGKEGFIMFCAHDLGASGTRFTTEDAKIHTLENNMAVMNSNELSHIEPYDREVLEESLEVFITKEGGSKIFPVHILSGKMATRYSGTNDTPSVNNHKYKQNINYIQAVMSTAVSLVKRGLDNQSLRLYIAVPPVEVLQAQEHFSEELVGKFTVDFPKYKNGVKVTFTVTEVSCQAESVMACTGYFFDLNGKVSEQAKEYLNGMVLSLDIGASTSDLAIIENGKYLDRSGQTYKTGGNVVRDIVSEYIVSEYGFDPDHDMADMAVIEGRLQLGDSFIEIGDVVSNAKRELARLLTNNIETYFKRINVPIQKIRAIMVSGGGSMQSQYTTSIGEIKKTSESMSYFVTERLKEWSPNTVVKNYGPESRHANIKGLYIRAMFDEQLRKQKSNVQQAPVRQAPVQQSANTTQAAGVEYNQQGQTTGTVMTEQTQTTGVEYNQQGQTTGTV